VCQQTAGEFRLTESLHGAGARIPEHAHRFPTVYFTLSGSFVEISEGRELPCEPMSVIFRPGEHEHADQIGPAGVRFFILEVRAEALGGGAAEWPRRTAVSTGILSARALALYRAFGAGDPETALRGDELCFELTREARRRLPDGASAAARRTRRAGAFIRENFARALRVEEIARAAGVHPVYLARLFRRIHGCSIAGYLRRCRIEEGLRRLLRGGEPIAEVALAIGFSDQSHFTREFRRESGRTPARFREASRRLSARASEEEARPA